MTAYMAAKPLTPKQMRFLDEYLVDCNGTQAAIRAGYSKRTANEQAAQLLAKLSIRREIEARRAMLAEEAQVTSKMVIDGLLKEARREGEDASHSARVAAWTQLAKHLGLFEQDNKQKRADPFDNLTPQQQMQLREIFALIDNGAGPGAAVRLAATGGKGPTTH